MADLRPQLRPMEVDIKAETPEEYGVPDDVMAQIVARPASTSYTVRLKVDDLKNGLIHEIELTGTRMTQRVKSYRHEDQVTMPATFNPRSWHEQQRMANDFPISPHSVLTNHYHA